MPLIGQVTDEELCRAPFMSNMLMCIYLQSRDKFQEARRHLIASVVTYRNKNRNKHTQTKSIPKRTSVAVALEAAALLLEANLVAVSRIALEIAEKAEKAAKTKADERKLQTGMPSQLMQWQRRLQASNERGRV